MDEVIDAVLNHAKQGVMKVYNQYRDDAEKQKAIWGLGAETKQYHIQQGTAIPKISR